MTPDPNLDLSKLAVIKSHKVIVSTLVKQHFDKRSMSTGREKGRGLTCILHGPPGVGKGSTVGKLSAMSGFSLFYDSLHLLVPLVGSHE